MTDHGPPHSDRCVQDAYNWIREKPSAQSSSARFFELGIKIEKKTCIKCGTEIEEGDAFCLNCGEPVK